MKLSLPDYLFPIICMLAGIVSQYSGLDIGLERFFYDAQQHLWPYKDLWLTENLLHKAGRDFAALIIISMLLFVIATLFNKGLMRYRRTASFMLLSSLTGIGLVAVLKDITHIYTPWDLQVFGGQYPHIRLFDTVADGLPVGHAFPSGHASGGYALLSIYFAARSLHYRHSSRLLYVALGIGLLFGIAQQMRGAHMLSHDLFTLAICWSSCLVWSALLLPAGKEEEVIAGVQKDGSSANRPDD
jgi:membrane-associated PAP2 superfamily phosphatase